MIRIPWPGPRFCRVLDSADRKGGVEGVMLMVTFNQNLEEIWKQMDFLSQKYYHLLV